MAAYLNKVFLMGNLTREPELRYTPGTNSAVCEFGIAVNRRFIQNGQEKDETCFVDIVAWGKQAETCSRFLQKGSGALVEGRLVFDQWVEKDTQKKRSRIRVTAEHVQFLNSARRDDAPQADGPDGGDPSAQYDSPRPQSYSRQSYPAQQQGGQGRYQRQQYGGAPAPRPPQAPGGAAPQQSAPQPPPMPEGDPMEDVDDIPF